MSFLLSIFWIELAGPYNLNMGMCSNLSLIDKSGDKTSTWEGQFLFNYLVIKVCERSASLGNNDCKGNYAICGNYCFKPANHCFM